MRTTLTMLAVPALSAFLCTATWAQNDTLQGPVPEVLQGINFAQPPPPSCVAYNFNVAVPTDVKPGGQDCCIRDDTVEVYVDQCLVGTIDSRGGADGTHPFTQVGPVTVLAGAHVVSYCNTVSDTPGPSGWTVDDLNPPSAGLLLPPTYTGGCGCTGAQLAVIGAVADESTFQNHGQYVKAATHALEPFAVSAECHSCIINQFARSVPQAEMVTCASSL